MFLSEGAYTVIDLLQEYPIQQYSNINYLEDGTVKYTNARGIIGQYFKDNNVAGKPNKYLYCPFGSEIFGQNANTMGRFVVFINFTKESFEGVTIEQIKNYIHTSRERKAFSERDDFLLYNRAGYEFLIKENREKKISKQQEKLELTYYVRDLSEEYDVFKVTATNCRQAINMFFKSHNIKETPYKMDNLWRELEEKSGYYARSVIPIEGRFYVYKATTPRLGTYYNRKGYAIIHHIMSPYKIICEDENKEYTVDELIEKFYEKDEMLSF